MFAKSSVRRSRRFQPGLESMPRWIAPTAIVVPTVDAIDATDCGTTTTSPVRPIFFPAPPPSPLMDPVTLTQDVVPTLITTNDPMEPVTLALP